LQINSTLLIQLERVILPYVHVVTMDGRKIAGALLLLACAQFTVLLIVAETQYPLYNPGTNYISDLGVWGKPSAIIFNSSIFLFGALGLAGAYLLRNDGEFGLLPWILSISSIGAMGVALFPETTGGFHTTSAFLAFAFGALGAVYCFFITDSIFRYFVLVMGSISLAALVLTGAHVDLGLGIGGIERMILYPVLLWLAALGTVILDPHVHVKRGY
jgi:hypothetical membrane protein